MFLENQLKVKIFKQVVKVLRHDYNKDYDLRTRNNSYHLNILSNTDTVHVIDDEALKEKPA